MDGHGKTCGAVNAAAAENNGFHRFSSTQLMGFPYFSIRGGNSKKTLFSKWNEISQ